MTEYPYFPLFVNLSGKKILIVGAGSIALRRAEALSPFGAELMVTAPEGRPEMEKLAAVWNRRRFQEEDLEGAVLVLAATDDKELNSLVAELCRERGIPVNSCSDRTQCDFYFPGIARRENLVIGVTASGKDHRLAATVGRTASKMAVRLVIILGAGLVLDSALFSIAVKIVRKSGKESE